MEIKSSDLFFVTCTNCKTRFQAKIFHLRKEMGVACPGCGKICKLKDEEYRQLKRKFIQEKKKSEIII